MSVAGPEPAVDAGDAEPSDDALLATLFLERYDALVRFAVATCGSSDAAEDAVQEAFARLFARPRRLRDRSAAESYLRSTVLNSARSAARRRPLLRRHHDAEPASEPTSPSTKRDAATVLVERDEIVRALHRLPRREREAVALRYLLDLSERETATALRVSVGAVKGYTSRGLAHLADQLGTPDG